MEINKQPFRITQTYHRNQIQFIYGVPLCCVTNRRSSATDYIKIQAARNTLPFEPKEGQQWLVLGQFEVNQAERYGRKYNDHHYKNPVLEIELPNVDEGFIKFIGNEIDGISDERARKLWGAFGNKIYGVLEDGDTSKLVRVSGIGETTAEALIDGFVKYKNLKHCNWLAKHKIPLRVQQLLLRKHSERSIDVIKNNPYELVVFGMPFTDVDEIAQETFKVPVESEQRLAAATRHTMNMLCKKGDTYINNERALRNKLHAIVGSEYVDAAFEAGQKHGAFAVSGDARYIHHHDLLLIEASVAKQIARVNNKPSEWSVDHDRAYANALSELPYKLTSKQEDAVKTSIHNNVTLITGGAGTGKTTVTRTVLRAYYDLGYEITALAVSGRAAMRLHESIGFPTSTIAKFLREPALVDYDNDSKKLEHIVVIDESSMVDITSLYRVLNHVAPKSRLLFVGDPHQLPPIGAGLVLSELERVESIPKTHLDIIKRQDSTTGIPGYAMNIRNGNIPSELSTGAIEFFDTQSDCVFC